jgi:hypothetical protein
VYPEEAEMNPTTTPPAKKILERIVGWTARRDPTGAQAHVHPVERPRTAPWTREVLNAHLT